MYEKQRMWKAHVMQEERRVSGRIIQVRAGVTADSVVTTTVDADGAGDEVLQQILKALYIRAVLDEKSDLLVSGLVGGLFADITAQTARVVAKAISLWIWLDAREMVLERAHVHFPAVTMLALLILEMSLTRSRRDTYSLKGPDSTQPPPLPGWRVTKQRASLGRQEALRPATYAPSPEILVSLPSNTGDFTGSLAHHGQL